MNHLLQTQKGRSITETDHPLALVYMGLCRCYGLSITIGLVQSPPFSSFEFICVKNALADAGQTFRISQVELVKTGITSRMLGPRGALTPFTVAMIIDDAGFGCPSHRRYREDLPMDTWGVLKGIPER